MRSPAETESGNDDRLSTREKALRINLDPPGLPQSVNLNHAHRRDKPLNLIRLKECLHSGGQSLPVTKFHQQVGVGEHSHDQSSITGDCKSPKSLGSLGTATRQGFLGFSGGTSMAAGRPWLVSVMRAPDWTFLISEHSSLRALPMGSVRVFMGKILHKICPAASSIHNGINSGRIPISSTFNRARLRSVPNLGLPA